MNFEEKYAERVAYCDQRVEQAQDDRRQIGTRAWIVGCIVVARSAFDENDDGDKQLKTLKWKVQLCITVRLKEITSLLAKQPKGSTKVNPVESD